MARDAHRRPPATRPFSAADALRWSPHWALVPAPADDRGTTVVVAAGADRVIAVDGASAAQVAAVSGWANGERVGVDGDPALAAMRDRLAEIGAIVPAFPGADDVVLIGTESAQPLLDTLAGLLPAPWRSRDGEQEPGVAVVVRTAPEWPPIPIERTHLGVDLTMDHTALFGPLVVPGATTCIGCMDSRTARRWGRPTVAAEPGVQALLPVIASLLAVQLRLARAGTSPLVNATVAWDFEQGTIDHQKAYKLPGCPTCNPQPSGGTDGRVRLPWTT